MYQTFFSFDPKICLPKIVSNFKHRFIICFNKRKLKIRLKMYFKVFKNDRPFLIEIVYLYLNLIWVSLKL